MVRRRRLPECHPIRVPRPRRPDQHQDVAGAPPPVPITLRADHPSPILAADIQDAVSGTSTRPQVVNNATGSTAAATDKPTPRSTSSSSRDSDGTAPPRHTWNDASPKDEPDARSSAASRPTSPEKSTEPSSTTSTRPPGPPNSPLDIHRSIGMGACLGCLVGTRRGARFSRTVGCGNE